MFVLISTTSSTRRWTIFICIFLFCFVLLCFDWRGCRWTWTLKRDSPEWQQRRPGDWVSGRPWKSTSTSSPKRPRTVPSTVLSWPFIGKNLKSKNLKLKKKKNFKLFVEIETGNSTARHSLWSIQRVTSSTPNWRPYRVRVTNGPTVPWSRPRCSPSSKKSSSTRRCRRGGRPSAKCGGSVSRFPSLHLIFACSFLLLLDSEWFVVGADDTRVLEAGLMM